MTISFKRNMGTVDRVLRTVVGLTLLILGPATGFITNDGLSTLILGIVGTTAVVSSLFSYCALYEISGFTTIKTLPKQ